MCLAGKVPPGHVPIYFCVSHMPYILNCKIEYYEYYIIRREKKFVVTSDRNLMTKEKYDNITGEVVSGDCFGDISSYPVKIESDGKLVKIHGPKIKISIQRFGWNIAGSGSVVIINKIVKGIIWASEEK